MAVKAFKNNQDGGAYLEYAWSDCGISVNGIKIGPTYLGKFDYRTNVNLKCSPNNGFSFVEWVKKVDSDEYLLSTKNSVDITLTDPETVVAAHITSI